MEGWCYVCVSLDFPCRWLVQVLCLADTCASEVHPVFNPIAPYGHLLSNMYLFIADIANPRLRDVVGPGFVSTSPAFMRSSASHPAGPPGWLAPKR